jgi:hypothetical protein
MAWVTPPTFVSGNVLTAAQLNTLSGDLNETAPAKASAGGQIFISTGANAIAVRTPSGATINTSESTASTVFTDLATLGPAVTLTTGTSALVFIGCFLGNSTNGDYSEMTFTASGASAIAAGNYSALRSSTESTAGTSAASQSITRVNPVTTLTAGSNTFSAKYRVNAGTGSFNNRDIYVIPFS